MAKNNTEESIYYSYLFEQEVKVVFSDGKLLIGKLTAVGQFELLLERDGKSITVFKGAIKYIYLNE